MDRVIETAPSAEPLSLDDVKKHMRITGSADDDLLTRLISAARQHVEKVCSRALITQTWDLYLPQFTNPMVLPLGQLQSVTHIKYYDTGGNQQTLDSGVYTVNDKPDPGEICLAYQQSWPSIRYIANAVEIRFVCGYGDATSDVPEPIRHAMVLLIAHWYERTEETIAGTTIANIPMGVDALLAPYRFRVV